MWVLPLTEYDTFGTEGPYLPLDDLRRTRRQGKMRQQQTRQAGVDQHQHWKPFSFVLYLVSSSFDRRVGGSCFIRKALHTPFSHDCQLPVAEVESFQVKTQYSTQGMERNISKKLIAPRTVVTRKEC